MAKEEDWLGGLQNHPQKSLMGGKNFSPEIKSGGLADSPKFAFKPPAIIDLVECIILLQNPRGGGGGGGDPRSPPCMKP